MTSNDDIRAWANENGHSLDAEDPIPVTVRRDYINATRTTGQESTSDTVEEKAPKVVSPKLADKAKDLVTKVRTASPSKSTNRAAKKVFARVPVDKILGRGWAILAQVVQPLNMPVARVLAVQSPVAGRILEEVVRDTTIDRILQPMARLEKRGELAFALIGPPLIVGAMTAKPESAGMLIPILREALRSWIDIAGPHLVEVAKQEAKFEEEYGQRIDQMIAMFFEDPSAEESVSPSVNGSRVVVG